MSEERILNFIFFKSLHVIEYSILYILLFRGLNKTSKIPLLSKIVVSLLLGVIYALSDEIHQTFVPTREGSIRDIGIDSGAMLLISVLIYSKYERFKKYL